MKRESFVFYRSWWEAIKNLPREMQGEVLTAIIEYGLDGVTTESLKPITSALLAMAKPQIDKNNQRYDNGNKGGRKKASETKSKPNETKTEPNDNQTETKQEPKPNQTETESKPNEDDNEYDYKKEESTSDDVPKKDGLSLPPIDYNALCQHFNKRFAGILPKVTSITETRRKAIRARIAEHGRESVIKVFDAIKASDFLKGHNDRNWQCDFDWIFRPTNYIKILEGTYANHPAQGMEVGVVLQDGKNKKYEEGW